MLAPGQIVTLPVAGPRHWLDWLLWCLVGAATYLFIQHVSFYRQIRQGGGGFVDEQYWYVAQLLTGPLIAFVVLQFLTRINFELLGFGGDAVVAIDINQFPMDLIFVMAFLLGYFSRMTRKLLERIAQRHFRRCLDEAQPDFEVIIKDASPSDNVIGSGANGRVRNSPQDFTALNWKANIGTMDQDVYSAPQARDKPLNVVVTASAADGSGLSTSRQFQIVPEKFTIVVEGGGTTLRPGDTRTLRFEPTATLLSQIKAEDIHWAVENVESSRRHDRLNQRTEHNTHDRPRRGGSKVGAFGGECNVFGV